MLRQLQLRAPIKGVQMMRSLTYNLRQLQPAALVDVDQREQQSASKQTGTRTQTQTQIQTMSVRTLCQMQEQSKTRNLPRLHFSMPQMLYEKLQNMRKYSVCQNPLDLQLQIDAGKINRSSNLPMRYEIGAVAQAESVALIPLEQTQMDQNVKNVGTTKSQPQPKLPEQSGRKIPYYNPLRRRSNVDPARVQYIKDRFKERSMESDRKPEIKKYVSRTTLHSGRLDKID